MSYQRKGALYTYFQHNKRFSNLPLSCEGSIFPLVVCTVVTAFLKRSNRRKRDLLVKRKFGVCLCRKVWVLKIEEGIIEGSQSSRQSWSGHRLYSSRSTRPTQQSRRFGLKENVSRHNKALTNPVGSFFRFSAILISLAVWALSSEKESYPRLGSWSGKERPPTLGVNVRMVRSSY